MTDTYYNPLTIAPGTRATAEQINAELLKVQAAFRMLPDPTAIGIGGGAPNYTWRAYADSADGTSNFTTGQPGSRAYFGTAVNRSIATPSQFPEDYTWQRVQGADAPIPRFEFAVDADGDFHLGYQTGDRYLRISTDGGATYSAPVVLTATDLADLDPAAAAALAGGSSARMSTIPNQTIRADYQGVVQDGQLPLQIGPRRFLGNDDVTGSTIWAMQPSGGITATINNTVNDAQRGVITVTAVAVDSGSIRVVSTRDGLDLEQTFYITRQNAAAPAQTGTTPVQPGASASDTTFEPIGNSAAFIAISDVLAVQVGASGNVQAQAGITFVIAQSTEEDQVFIELQWKYSADGTTYTNEGAVGPSTVAASRWFSSMVPKGPMRQDGYAPLTITKTGLTAGATARFQLFGRKSDGIASVTGETGSATVVPQ